MSWPQLVQELNAWRRVGRKPCMWWRDDDVQRQTAALNRLLDLTARHNISPCLAAIPALVDPRLCERLSINPETKVAIHGFYHRNHASSGARKVEWGSDRPSSEILIEIEASYNRINSLFGSLALPVLVPPWNRIDSSLFPHLHPLGIRGLSTLGARTADEASPGVQQVNVHLDVLSWRPKPHFRGVDECLNTLVQHLYDRRMGITDQDEPIGLLTHHLVLDEPSWEFLDSLLEVLKTGETTFWPYPNKLFSLET